MRAGGWWSIEANSVGTPAVGYDVPGMRDSVRDGLTGRLAPAGDPEQLAEHAVDLVADERRYADMSRQASVWAKRFSWNETARRLLEVVARSVDRADYDNERREAA